MMVPINSGLVWEHTNLSSAKSVIMSENQTSRLSTKMIWFIKFAALVSLSSSMRNREDADFKLIINNKKLLYDQVLADIS